MNEPKKRGRPAKAKLADFSGGNGTPVDMDKPIQFYQSPAPCAECGQAEGHYDDCPVGMGVPSVFTQRQAQAYANRVWSGQSPDVGRAERIARVTRALAGQGLSMDGVTLP